ncbi:PLDc N-terminal domain-containing protein [Staphylococcus agnetis]|uniref:PLDc N-terminal domain-containing protein n=1 Tax=Staphylococcus agnetis TaxID=985762 RepID=UPI0004E29EE9|nr:PLDc N-terminal domain-containing protein [Staphylococcus agnetis]KFE41065.1 yxlE-like protein [Staphylococcus agnetis]NJH65184.1 hypothetical protein [Staphylococcus agnetis]NJH97157.1 hypothetical protein [Staphylococcus agnetis]PTH46982.1 hypothetical protein BU587_08195 [Staphylococcus agnetis]PTH71425.1 hypothetical protein BU580_11570 [Staphylococcus agnetis]
MDIKILVPILLLLVLYLIVCFYDLVKVNDTKYLPKWIWGIIICISIPLGGIVYFLFARKISGEENE